RSHLHDRPTLRSADLLLASGCCQDEVQRGISLGPPPLLEHYPPSIHMRLAHAQTSPQPRRRGCKSPGVVAQRVECETINLATSRSEERRVGKEMRHGG